MNPSPLLMTAVQNHQAGRFAAADELYRQAIAANPNDMHALHLAGVLAHQTDRHDRAAELIGRAIALDGQVPDFHYNIGLALWALNRRQEASEHWARAVALRPAFAEARLNLGNALREEGRFEEAIAQHSGAARLQPQSPVAHNGLGLSLARAGRDAEALPHYRQAIALQPQFIDAYLNLAMLHSRRGEVSEALVLVMRSIEIRETPENKALFAWLVAGISIDRDEARLRGLLMRALAEGWAAPGPLAPACIGLIRHGPESALIARAAKAWPARLSIIELFGSPRLPGLNDPLLQSLMTRTVIGDTAIEKFLAVWRFTLLECAEAAKDDGEAPLETASALARQCFINEYVYSASDTEQARARQLRDRLDAALISGDPVPALWVMAVAAYFPLHELVAAASLLGRAWPTPLEPLLKEQIREPQEQAALRAGIRQLTPIEDDVSRAVQAQYEASPYPRWIETGTPRKFTDINVFLREILPAARFRALEKAGNLDILIAGCGTGQHAILTARQFTSARVLAIDLSRASLAYAVAKTCALGLDAIEYAQADILRLGSLERRFDLIDSVGVLHHLADPYAGWRTLLSLLRPGGFMRIGLYSEIARWGIVAARAEIAQAGYGPSAAEIRRFRQELMQRDDDVARDIARFNDFYSLSECRDLLFHTQEHRMMLPEINGFLAEQGLQLLGLEVDRTTARHYATRFPADVSMTDLGQWDAFERDNPRTFETMYRLWLQKPPA
jgi:Flp pilus assembly protein TadD/SAM-dependent methyltransferase